MASVEERVKQIIVEQLGVDEGEVTPTASFVDDLGADSLDTVELVMAFEEAFGIEIPDEDAEKIATVKDAVDYIQKHGPKKKLASCRRAIRRISAVSRRVVVTGVGLVCGLGIGTEEVWANLLAGKSGIRAITHFDTTAFDCTIAGEVRGFEPLHWVEKKELKKMGRFIQIALAATDFAMRMADLKITPDIAEMAGVYVASGIGGFDVIEREHSKLLQGGPGRISAFFIPAAIVNLASGHISIRYGAKGPNSATATACSASAHAVGDSFKIIERGAAEMMICGATEATITPMGVGGFASMKALSTRNEDPAHASRPFDLNRDGFVVGEGAGILILESLEHAQKRNAPILAEIVGSGMSGDPYHITHPPAAADAAHRVMRAAIKDAKLKPEDISYVNAHGTSTPIGDVIETRALKRVFGDNSKNVPVSSTKSMTGHLP